MAARNSIGWLRGHGVYLFIYGLLTLCVPWGTAQMRRPLKMNLPDSAIIQRLERTETPGKALTAKPANLSAPTVLQIAGDVYEYNYILPTGVGRYHSVGVHRVVRVQNGKPAAGHNAIFLAHGSEGSFDTDFMNATKLTRSLSSAAFNGGSARSDSFAGFGNTRALRYFAVSSSTTERTESAMLNR
jgi:hypothetical protein